MNEYIYFCLETSCYGHMYSKPISSYYGHPLKFIRDQQWYKNYMFNIS